jgi:hypothetical protein
MIEIIGIYYIGYVYSYMLAYNEQNLSYSCLGEEFNNEYFQSVRQGYEFTYIDHIYQKEDKYYIYNNKTLLFDPIDGDLNCEASKPTPKKCTIGQNEKCKTCDENDPEICGVTRVLFLWSYHFLFSSHLCILKLTSGQLPSWQQKWLH